MTDGKAMQLSYVFLESPVTASSGKIFHTGMKLFCAFLIPFLQKLCQHILLHQLQLTLICDPEGRIQPDIVKIIPDNKETEAVNGRDLCIVEKSALLLQMLIFRILKQRPFYGKADPLPHFCRRSTGKGHHQKPVNIDRCFLPGDHPYDPLNQHRCLTASCSR